MAQLLGLWNPSAMAIAFPQPSLFDSLQLGNGLSLIPRLRFSLAFIRADLSVKPIDEWQLKESLIAFLKDNFALSISDRDLSVHKERDLRKRRRDEPVASGVLYIWNLRGLVARELADGSIDSQEGILKEKELLVLEKLNGMEMHFGGMKLRCQARFYDTDNFDVMRNSWQAIYGTNNEDQQFQKLGRQPDTLILKGIPSRWFAEPRVSSKASILVTHTIFSKFGMVRNLDVREAQDVGNSVSTALDCHVWIQYDQYSGFFTAIKAFSGRSMQREGSSFKANYELSWDKEGYFMETKIRKRKFEKENFEEQQRRQLALEARQAEIAIQQAAFTRLEQQRREYEQRERTLREEEEKREQERELGRMEEARQKQEEEHHKLREELTQRKEREHIMFERQRQERELQEELTHARMEGTKGKRRFEALSHAEKNYRHHPQMSYKGELSERKERERSTLEGQREEGELQEELIHAKREDHKGKRLIEGEFSERKESEHITLEGQREEGELQEELIHAKREDRKGKRLIEEVGKRDAGKRQFEDQLQWMEADGDFKHPRHRHRWLEEDVRCRVERESFRDYHDNLLGFQAFEAERWVLQDFQSETLAFVLEKPKQPGKDFHYVSEENVTPHSHAGSKRLQSVVVDMR